MTNDNIIPLLIIVNGSFPPLIFLQ